MLKCDLIHFIMFKAAFYKIFVAIFILMKNDEGKNKAQNSE